MFSLGKFAHLGCRERLARTKRHVTIITNEIPDTARNSKIHELRGSLRMLTLVNMEILFFRGLAFIKNMSHKTIKFTRKELLVARYWVLTRAPFTQEASRCSAQLSIMTLHPCFIVSNSYTEKELKHITLPQSWLKLRFHRPHPPKNITRSSMRPSHLSGFYTPLAY